MNNKEKKLLYKIFEFGSFTWRIHRDNPDFNIPRVPWKIQFRHSMRAIPELCELVSNYFVAKIKELGLEKKFDAVADLPLSISPVVSLVYQRLNMPMVTLDYKHNIILGKTYPGMKLLGIDDVLSFGGSKEDAYKLAEDNDLEIIGLMIFVDYELGSAERLRKEYKIDVYSIFTISELLKQLNGVLLDSNIEKINNWLEYLRERIHLFS